ncbi:MAG: MtrB/PioB family outer membrane beta-barrel protein [Candidatus Tectomicrobia bacterium]|nr:MtrB/PioB family outer membrane beta-barrel protein [Candidatus Tectomicrobia bacterium]
MAYGLLGALLAVLACWSIAARAQGDDAAATGITGLFQRQEGFAGSITTSLSVLDVAKDKANLREDQGLFEQDLTGTLDSLSLRNATADGYYLNFDAGLGALRRDGFVNFVLGRRGVFALRGNYEQSRKYYDDSRGEPYREFPGIFDLGQNIFTTRRNLGLELELRLPQGPHLRGGYERRAERGNVMLLKGSPVGGRPELRLYPTTMDQDTLSQRYFLEADQRFGRVNVEWQGSYEQVGNTERITERQFGSRDVETTVQVDDHNRAAIVTTSATVSSYLHRKLFVALSGSYLDADAEPGASRLFANTRFFDFLRFLEEGEVSKRRHSQNLGVVYAPFPSLSLRAKALVAKQDEEGFAIEREVRTDLSGPAAVTATTVNDTERDRFSHAESIEAAFFGIPKTTVRAGFENEESNEDFDLVRTLLPVARLSGERFEDVEQTERRAYVKAAYRPIRRLRLLGGYARRWHEADKDFSRALNFFQLDDSNRVADELKFGVSLQPLRQLTVVTEYRYLDSRYELDTAPDADTSQRTQHLTLNLDSQLHPRLSAYGYLDVLVDDGDIDEALPPIAASFAPVSFEQSAVTYALGLRVTPIDRLTANLSWTESIARNAVHNNYRTLNLETGYELSKRYHLDGRYSYFDFSEPTGTDDYRGHLFIVSITARF